MTDSTFESRLEKFQADLSIHDAATVTHRNILGGTCFALEHDQYMALKEGVARHFNVASMEIVVVGSAKLGFSIAPTKRYRRFNDDSDIDVAIASPALFDEIWQRSLEFHLDEATYWPNLNHFRKCLFRGWIRPDLLPNDDSFPLSQEWFEFFRELTRSDDFGQIKITGALYRTWQHLELYQWGSVLGCQEAAEKETI